MGKGRVLFSFFFGSFGITGGLLAWDSPGFSAFSVGGTGGAITNAVDQQGNIMLSDESYIETNTAVTLQPTDTILARIKAGSFPFTSPPGLSV